MKTIPEIHFEEKGHIGLITLTRQQALNALNHAMFLALDAQLTEWKNAKHIHAVIIRAAEGRAFCAGGDIRHAYELKKANDPSITTFFYDEYQMNQLIHHYPKPYVALLDGITMGGGVGISWHGSHRVATEKLLFSMPETGIGFYPDVGTTYHLSRSPHHFGYYVGLTGARLNVADSIALGFAQYFVAHEQLPSLLDALIQSSASEITYIIETFSQPPGPSTLLEQASEIDRCFSLKTIEDILFALEKTENEWCHQTAALLKTKSPTSLKVTLLALQKAASLTFDECMKMEYQLTCAFTKDHDFFEGIRAVVIDKDQKPQWNPLHLNDVKIDAYFKSLAAEKGML